MRHVNRDNIIKAIWINILILIFFNLFYSAQIFVDDLVQFVDLNGLYTNVSDYHLQWGGMVLGKVLQFFCDVAPRYNWYAANQYAISFVSLTIFSYLILSKQWGNIEKYILFTILFSCGYELYVTLGFTKTSGIIGAITIYIFVSDDTSKWLKLVSGILFWWSTQIRFSYIEMFEAGVIFVLIIKMIYNYKDKLYVRNCMKRIAFLLIFFAIIITENKIEGIVKKQDIIWNEYSLRNTYRSTVYDRGKIYSNYNEYADEYLKLGITKSMAEMWHTNNPDFKYPDSDNFSEALSVGEKMSYEGNNISKFFDADKINKFFKTDVFRNIKTDVWLMFLILSLFAFILFEENKKIIGAFSISIGIFLAFEYYLYVNGRYARHRVDVSVAIFIVIIFLLLIDKITVTSRQINIGRALMITFLLYSLIAYNNYSEDYNTATERIQSQIEANQLFYEQTNLDMSNVYFQIITNGAAGGNGYYDSFLSKYAFDKMEPGYLKNVMFAYSTPIKDEVMQEKYGITDVWLDVIDNENMYIVIPNDQYGNNMVSLVSNYLSDRKGEVVRLIKVKYYSDKNVYRAYTDSYQLSQTVTDDMSKQEYSRYKLAGGSFDSGGICLSCDVTDSVIELSGKVCVTSDYDFQNKVYLCVEDKETGRKNFYDVFQNFGDTVIEESYEINLSQELPEYYSENDELTLVMRRAR